MARTDDADRGCAACGSSSPKQSSERSCGCPSCHDSSDRETGNEALREGVSLALAALLAIAAVLWERGGLGLTPSLRVSLVLFLAAYVVAGWNVVLGAVRNILAGHPFDELFLMTVSTVGAFLIRHPEEAVGVMVFYKLGEMFQESAASKSRRSIEAVLALRPDRARVLRNGAEEDVPPEDVAIGELVRVRPGERVPLDGVVEDGQGWLDSSALTGESRPRRVSSGAEVLAGAIAGEGVLTVRVSRPAAQSYAARIVDLVENAANAKARPERFITRFARWYTPAVVVLALLIAFLPPLAVPGQSLSAWVYRALVMLVISCPCALVLSVPLGYFAGLGGAARRGILVKGAGPFEVLAETRSVVFDKTGTLTSGDFAVLALEPASGRTGAEMLALAAEAEAGSNHPIAAALRRAFEGASDGSRPLTGSPTLGPSSVTRSELPGKGVSARIGDTVILAGTEGFLASEGVVLPAHVTGSGDGKTRVYVSEAGRFVGRIVLGDTVKPGSVRAIEELKALGIRRLALLSGDAEEPVRSVAEGLGIGEAHAGLLPHEKLEVLGAFMESETDASGRTVFVGDGVNDAPVLARADVGIAMGAGADAALETADVVLMTGEPERVPEAIVRARRTRRIVRQNIVFALGFKAVFLALGAAGMANMWEAVVADVGVALIAVLNATRALR